MSLGPDILKTRAKSGFALRGRHLLVIDVICIAVAFVVAFALRLDAPSAEFQRYLLRFAWLILPLLLARVSVNLAFRLYQRLWRYASIDEMQAIVLATTAGSLLFGTLLLALSFGGPDRPAYGFPRSVVGIEWLLSTALLGASRFSLRTIRAGRRVLDGDVDAGTAASPKRVLVVGAGDAGANVVKELHLRPRLGMRPVGFIDDDPIKKGKWIHGVRVAGSLAELPDLVERLGVESVIVAMPSAPGSVIREILSSCERIGIRVMTVPGIAELISGKVSVSQIRPVQVEDLLRREPAQMDMEAIAGFAARRDGVGHGSRGIHRLRAVPADCRLLARPDDPAGPGREQHLQHPDGAGAAIHGEASISFQ